MSMETEGREILRSWDAWLEPGQILRSVSKLVAEQHMQELTRSHSSTMIPLFLKPVRIKHGVVKDEETCF